ncbi:acetyl-CoA carboxylase biotin carboxylase subunit [Hydrogenobaculum acidophilum]
MIKKVLIANRGEVAVRIIRACKELDIKTVAIYSEADINSLHIKKADEAYLIPMDPIKAYLDYNKIINIAKQSKADAIHPGYGFLSENAEFAQACIDAGLIFIGPTPEQIETFGDKVKAKKVMKNLGVPVVPGSDGPITKLEDAYDIANEIGYPIILKAAYGGGGRGMRVVYKKEDLKQNFESAQKESLAFFGKGDIFIEKYIQKPKHIEVQILADKYGNVVHLGERDCSIQRRHQKIIEITPSPSLDKSVRNKMLGMSVRAMMKYGYESAGTIEFILDQTTNEFYFIEMNTRLQVEHTITEMVTGIDIVEQMIRIANGEPLSFVQNDISFRGCAIQFRINAEDPTRNFAPSPGRITAYHSPGGIGVRMDSAIYKDYIIPPYYDSLVSKLCVWALDWERAIARAKRALDEFIIRGIPTNLQLHREIIRDEEFIRGDFDTSFLDNRLSQYDYKIEGEKPKDVLALAISAALASYYGL